MARAYVGVGANLGDAETSVLAALDRLAELGRVVLRSSLYQTAPWGVREQPPFVNAVALLETHLQPRALLDALKRLERDLGRQNGLRYGPREIDLDILTYGQRRIDDVGLHIPHPRLFERAFVLIPLAEIDPSYARAAASLSDAARAEVVPLHEVKRGTPCDRRDRRDVDWAELTARLRSIASACVAGDLERVRVLDHDLELEVMRTPGRSPAAAPSAPVADPTQLAPSPNGAVPHAPEPALVRSDVVGVVRMSHPAVAEGAVLSEERELAAVESLGIRNPVSSGGSGRIVRVFVEEGQPVDYGQPLFAIERQ